MVQRLLAIVSVIALTACDTRVGGVVGVQPPATRLGFVIQPSNTQANTPISAVQVAIQNVNGQTSTSSNAVVTLSITAGTGTLGAVLTGGAPQAAVGGVATFSNLRIDLPGNGYSLTATAPGMTTAVSVQFTIIP